MICRAASAAAERTAGPIDGVVDEPAEIDAYGPRAESPSDEVDAVERQAELLGRDLRHRGRGAGADVLHRGDHGRAPVGAEAHPGVRGRAAAAVPDLARQADAALPRPFAPRAHLVPPLPVRLGAPVALHQVLRGVRPVVGRSARSSAAAARADRCQLRGQLVEQALEPERALDEARARGTPSSAAC